MPFRFEKLKIPQVVLVEAKAWVDSRGFFAETYKRSEFAANGIPGPFVQSNRSYSIQGVLRGLHYQMEPKAQGKLLSVVRGCVFDVAVDIRRGSPTYGEWIGLELSGENLRMLYVPSGFAHGFCVLSEEADVVYQVTEEFAPDLERGIIWNDPDIGIQWPVSEPILSPRDAQLPLLRAAENPFKFE